MAKRRRTEHETAALAAAFLSRGGGCDQRAPRGAMRAGEGVCHAHAGAWMERAGGKMTILPPMPTKEEAAAAIFPGAKLETQ